jgi:hypothetical protein
MGRGKVEGKTHRWGLIIEPMKARKIQSDHLQAFKSNHILRGSVCVCVCVCVCVVCEQA